jgi:hypothetical protein
MVIIHTAGIMYTYTISAGASAAYLVLKLTTDAVLIARLLPAGFPTGCRDGVDGRSRAGSAVVILGHSMTTGGSFLFLKRRWLGNSSFSAISTGATSS